jgi:hypothetical protein
MTRSRRFSRKKGPVRSKKTKHDGIQFASGLEKHMYIALKKLNLRHNTRDKLTSLSLLLTSNKKLMNDKVMVKVNTVIEETKKYLTLSILQILSEVTLLLNVRDVLMNLFPYAGSYLKLTYINTYRTLHYINLKTKRNAKKP